ncbi:unnamed protein product [Protopolystoma xenopodis]|uniref:Uncharacterized protein n=1 Tax=Protopolystoma xenopodis TaxID=117903 RepID=A0A3S5BZ09_9PLAT|nr:unnamed protein product [Protopolystoma xenopodis]
MVITHKITSNDPFSWRQNTGPIPSPGLLPHSTYATSCGSATRGITTYRAFTLRSGPPHRGINSRVSLPVRQPPPSVHTAAPLTNSRASAVVAALTARQRAFGGVMNGSDPQRVLPTSFSIVESGPLPLSRYAFLPALHQQFHLQAKFLRPHGLRTNLGPGVGLGLPNVTNRADDSEEEEEEAYNSVEPYTCTAALAQRRKNSPELWLRRVERLTRFLERRPHRGELIAKNILPSTTPEERAEMRVEIEATLERRLSQRPTAGELEQKNILHCK